MFKDRAAARIFSHWSLLQQPKKALVNCSGEESRPPKAGALSGLVGQRVVDIVRDIEVFVYYVKFNIEIELQLLGFN